jgi:CDP-4-dehydro-6-deoxyglucose reductase
MSFKIRVRPSGHEFCSELQSSVLRAGLLEGINLDHNCANGTCGECRARLVEGELEQVRNHDHRLSDAEKADGWFLMCCHRARSDLLIETHESDQAADIAEQHITAKVGKIDVLQEEVIQLNVRTPRSKGLHFLAGQGVTLHFDGMRPKHLPIASCPCDSIQLRFHVRRRAGDAFSEMLFEYLKKGREVVISGPTGEFTLHEESSRPIIFVAWESGFAPVASLIDHAIQKDPDREIHLYWLSEIPRGHYLSNYCRAWRDALDNFHYHSVDLQPSGPESFESVFKHIAERHRPLQEWDIYLTLPAAEQYRACSLLCDAGMPAEQMKVALLQHP